MMNITNLTETLNPPSKLWSDYVQIGYFLLMVGFGVPLNLYSLIKAISNTNFGFMRLMKIHLALTDLMILCFFALSKLIWWSTYEWLAGDFVCKLVHFCSSFAFCSCSNLIASVAIVRWLVVRRITQTYSLETHNFFMILCFAYGLAAICSLPQFLIWAVFHPFAKYPTWAQCVTKWSIANWNSDGNIRFTEEHIYSILHLLFIFWIPFFIVIISYLRVFFLLKRNIREIDTTFYNIKQYSVLNADGKMDSTLEYTDLSTQLMAQSENTMISTNFSCAHETVPLKKLSQKSLSTCTLIKAKNNMVKRTAYILLTYIVCWSSYNTLAFLQQLGLIIENNHYRLFYNLIVLNAVLNPFIYGI